MNAVGTPTPNPGHPAIRAFGRATETLTQAAQLMSHPQDAQPMQLSNLLEDGHEHFLSGVTKFVTNGPNGATDQFTTNLWSDELQLRNLSESVTALEQRGARLTAGDLAQAIDFPVNRAIGDARSAIGLLNPQDTGLID